MSLPTIVSFVMPTLGLLLLSLWAPSENSFLGGGYFAWFLVGSTLLIVATLAFLRRGPRMWKNGSLMLWLAAACYMGGYSALHLDRDRCTVLRNAAVAMQKAPGGLDAAAQERWDSHRGGDRTIDAAAVQQLEADDQMLIALQYVLALLFVGTFYMIGVYASPESQREYGVLKEELEDPLAFKAIYGIQ